MERIASAMPLNDEMVSAMEMPLYRCHKQVWALKIASISPGRKDGKGPGMTLVFEDSRYAPLSVDEEWISRHNPQDGGYFVAYRDGYKSFSPAVAFEEGYTKV